MLEVPATQFVKNFGQYKARVQREAIAITSHGRTSGYFVSEQDFNEYLQLKARSRHAYPISELPEETLNAIVTAQMSPAHDHLDALMD
ncbi:MAG: type II toxin-antitoxin system Phd/YefM family antitoxin [Methylococcales bacterium]